MKPRRLRISAYAILQEAGQILLCRLSKELPQWEGRWTLPGGGLEFGESPEAAVIREAREETGLEIRVRSIATIDSLYDASRPHEEFHGLRILYHADVVGGELRDEACGSTDRCAWHEIPLAPDVRLVDIAEVGVRLARPFERGSETLRGAVWEQ